MSALLIKYLMLNKKDSILAVDADPNSTLHEVLGMKNVDTMAGVVEDISKHMDKIPSGMTKDRFITMRVQETLVEEKEFDLLAMGRPEGPGCYCYVNNLLREIIAKVTKNYKFVVIDNAAGMEHISRRTMRVIDKLVLVSDDSAVGIRSVKRIYDLANELGIKVGGVFFIVNKLKDSIGALEGEIQKTGLAFAGSIPYDEELHKSSVDGKSIFEVNSPLASDAMGKIFDNLIKR